MNGYKLKKKWWFISTVDRNIFEDVLLYTCRESQVLSVKWKLILDNINSHTETKRRDVTNLNYTEMNMEHQQ